MKEIQLTKGYVAFVDDDDFARVNQFKWTAVVTGQNIKRVYAYRRTGWDNAKRRWTQTVWLHRFVLDVPSYLDVDHINSNTLDNRKENLRPATRSQNLARNRRQNKFGYRGVRQGRRDKMFYMQIQIADKKIVSQHATAEEAARAYDVMAIKLHGEFARLNFPAV